MKPFRKNASVIARLNGKFLLVRKPRDRHAWQFPQGGVEAGESFTEAARREFAEEIGINLSKISTELGVYFYDFAENMELAPELQKFRGQEIHFFRTELPPDSKIQLDQKEIVEFRFVDVAELQRFIESSEYLKKILEIINDK